MNRRTLLTAGTAWLGASCRPVAALAEAPGPRLHPVLVDEGRVIDVTVGLRPFRATGFRVEAVSRGTTLVVHHYGHGGAGMSLSWGTAALAADLATEHPAREAAVLGAGVVGLTTARQLQRRGFSVTVYAASMPPYTTSNQSLATWTPSSGLVHDRTAEFLAQYPRAVEIALQELRRLVGRGYGVSWFDVYSLRTSARTDDRRSSTSVPWEPVRPADHPFDYPHVYRRPRLRIEPGPYLDALVRDVRLAGGAFRVVQFDDVAQIDQLAEPVVMNCLGLAGGGLFGDASVVPVKGQLVHLVPQREVTYGLSSVQSDLADFVYMAPRADGVVLGGLARSGDASLEPDPAVTARILAAHAAIFDGWRSATH